MTSRWRDRVPGSRHFARAAIAVCGSGLGGCSAWPEAGGRLLVVELPGAALLAILLLFVALVLLVFRFGAVASRSRRQRDRTAYELHQAQAALAVAPCGYLGWTADGGEIASPAVAHVLGVEGAGPLTWSAIQHFFGEADAAIVGDAVAALRTAGTPFSLSVATRDGERSLRVVGTRSSMGGEALDLIWLLDTTANASIIGQLVDDAADLSAERSRLRSLLDILPLPVWQRARDLSLTYCNSAYATAVEADHPAAAVLDERELAAGAIQGTGHALAERARRTGSAQSESHHVVIGGARRLLEFTEAPLGGNGLIGGFAQDFTAMESVQADLGRYVEALSEVLEQLRSAIAMFDPDCRLKFFNGAYATLWRLDPEWLRSEPEFGEILEVLRERRRLPEVADFRAHKAASLQRFNSVIEPEEEYLYLPDDTTIRQIAAPHPLGGLMFIYEDVTDRLALERSYNTLIAVQRETLNELREGVAVFGADGRLKLCNPAYRRIWDFKQDDMNSEPHIADLLEKVRPLYRIDGDWQAFKSEVVSRILHRMPATGRYVRTDGKVLDFATVPLPDGSVLESESDVTDTYNIERALVERNAALQEADRLKTEFLANVSYELRTPLNTIIGFAEILTNGYFGPLNRRQGEYTAGILEASQRLLALVNDILDLAMIEAGQIELDLAAFDVQAMLAAVLNLARERARKQSLRISLHCSPEIGQMTGDERRLKQVLFNLVSNAVKFTPPGGVVSVAADRLDGELRIQVADTGIGIQQEDLERVFGAFAHGRTGEHRPAGAGLGLTLVKRFIDMHGGRVELASRPGEGTAVRCYIPLDGNAARQHARPGPVPAG